MIYRCILPEWAREEFPEKKRVVEGEFSDKEIKNLNKHSYNIFYLPNYPSLYEGGAVDGFHIDTFEYVFVDMDLKDGIYKDKESFVEEVIKFPVNVTKLVDSGNGVHAYWKLTDLDAISYLKLQRRLMRHFRTDEAVGQIYQLMRVPGTINTKIKDEPKECVLLYDNEDGVYSSDQLDSVLPILTTEDEEYCKRHHERTYTQALKSDKVSYKIPLKFAKLLDDNEEVKELWTGKTDDRSKADFRLGHIMFGNGFTREEAVATLVNTEKAMSRAPVHQLAYATNIVDKIWEFEIQGNDLNLSMSVKDILSRSGDSIRSTRFKCHDYLDDTAYGFRLGQVIGLIAGSGVGKTAVALNMFEGFVNNNPDYVHFFIPLEQPPNEIAERWQKICGDRTDMHDKVQIMSNYEENGTFRKLSFSDIKDYILKFKRVTGKQIGCIVIDHIAALSKKGDNGENQDLMEICHQMKGFAIETNSLLVMQSQAPRQKAGIGDIELDKDAAYGTVYFESYCDFVITMWQPLKRCYADGAPTVTALKFCKIRHKNQAKDAIKEDVCYRLMYDSETNKLREFTQHEEKGFSFWLNQSKAKRTKDKTSDLVEYKDMAWQKN